MQIPSFLRIAKNYLHLQPAQLVIEIHHEQSVDHYPDLISHSSEGDHFHDENHPNVCDSIILVVSKCGQSFPSACYQGDGFRHSWI
jgi:hypothetical protein